MPQKQSQVWVQMTASKNRERGIVKRVISGNQWTNSLALTSSRVPYSSVQFRPGQTPCLISVTSRKNWWFLTATQVSKVWKSGNSRDVTASSGRLDYRHPVTRHLRRLREGQAGAVGGEREEDKGPEWERYAVESSCPRRVRFDSRQRGLAGRQQERGQLATFNPSRVRRCGVKSERHAPSSPEGFSGADKATPPPKLKKTGTDK